MFPWIPHLSVHVLVIYMMAGMPQVTFSQHTISGQVTDLEHGVPLAGVHVVLKPLTDTLSFTTDAITTADGYFALPEIPSGSWHIQTTHFNPTHRIDVTSPIAVFAGEGLVFHVRTPTEYIPWLDIAPVGQKTISTITGEMQAGEVLDVRGRALPDVQTTMTPALGGTLYGQILRSGQPLTEARITLSSGATTRTSLSGWFEFKNVELGTYHLHITSPQQAQEVEVTIEEGYQHIQLEMGREK